MTPEYRRLLDAARRELEADLANAAWGPEEYARHHARMWDLYHPGAGLYEVGREVVCRHVAEEIMLEAEQRGSVGVIDLWRCNVSDGSLYSHHATVTVKIGEDWFYLESWRPAGQRHRGEWRKIRGDGSHTMARSGAIDVAWYRNIPGGRNLAEWNGEAPDSYRSMWRQQLLGHRLQQIREVRTGEAEELTDGDQDDRKVPI